MHLKDFRLKIIDLFAKDLSQDFTILQISKQFKKSYSFINKEVRNLINQGILRKRIVGNAILCSLDFSNHRTILYLALNSFENKTESQNTDFDALIEELQKHDVIHSVYFSDKTLCIICENQVRVSHFVPYDIKFLALDKRQFREHIREHLLKDPLVLSGFENFWTLVGDAR
ncbi:hypothetical protein JW968_06540 [Candidatus Woesearchaeota archaeon]|nr:hypothetical protein [Candidatus Woesearchaeota archaeon]